MKCKQQLDNLISSTTSHLIYEEECQCPICKSKISPVFIAASLNTASTATVFNHCRSCSNSFMSIYSISKNGSSSSTVHLYDGVLSHSEPCRFTKYCFDDNILSLSPQFDKIYNQALAAETYGLDEIAGLGYRKSLEFLVKDFAIHEHPDSTDEIKSMPLSQCIKNHIDNPQIKMLAERSAWIGNDEAHYIRKQESRDVNDMKAFIKATVYFISMILITEDAASITPAK